MSKKNGFLTLKIVLAMGIVLVCIMAAIARYSGGQTPHVSGPEELRRVLWRQQMLSLPQLPQDGVPVFVDAGDFVYAGTNDDAIALADGLVPAEGENGTLCWPVTLFEDVSTRETVFLNADGEEAGRLSPPLDYDPLWLLESFFPEGVPDDVDEAIYDPALVVVTATLLAETEGERPGSHAAVASGGRAGAFAGRLPGASADTAAGTRAATGTGGVRTPPGKTETPVERSVLGGGSGSNQVYYADASRPDDGGDGLTWATAKRTIQAAVDIASDGDLVLVTNGVYDAGSRVAPGGASMNRLVITNAVTVRSVGGAGVTVIEGEGGSEYETLNACRCVFMTHGVLDGFTLKEGLSGVPGTGAPVHIDNAGGCVSMFGASEGTEVRNCVIRSGFANYGGGAFAGRLVNCVLHDDVADNGGGCALSALWNCTVTDNGAFYCAGVYNCSVTNSVVYGNLSEGGGGEHNHSGSQFGYSCSTPLPAGTGNIDQDPQFAAATNAEYRLLAWSPCINAGDNASLMSEADLLGNARVRGGTVDMGAYEMSPDGDIDGDGLTDSEELQVYRTSAVNPDTDGDGLDDAEEVFSRVMEWGLQTNTTSWVTPPKHFGKITRLRAANGIQLSYFQHNAALKATGEAVCWGYNSSGQCNVPESATNLVDIAAGGNHVAALRDNGTVVCWGRDLYGECTPPTGAVDVVAVSAGWYHNAAVKSNGTVVCWGYNNYGQCTVTSGLSNVKAVAAGGCHTVALLVDGSVICWGSNSSGQCAVTSGVSNVKAVAAGGAHSMALLDGGAVVCWGNNAQGQCSVPAGVTNAVAISAGSMHSMACLADGRIVCWGWNLAGQSASQTPYAAALDLDGGAKYSVALVAGNTDPLDADSDDDGLEDGAEVSVHKTDPNNPDTDGDGLKDGAEIARGTGVLDPDSDDDGLKDGWEVLHGFLPLVVQTDGVHGPADDPDGDGLTNAAESILWTDPFSDDTDRDGLKDGWEVSNGLDPLSGLSGSLAGWWQFREGSGTVSDDLSGNGNDAFIVRTNGVSWVSGAPSGAALRFRTESDTGAVSYNGGYVCVPSLSNAPVASGFSVAAWVRADSYPSYATVLTKSSDHDAWSDGVSLYHEDLDSVSFYAGDWNQGHVGSGVNTTGAWLHVCGVFDGTNTRIFVNGLLCGMATNFSGSATNADPLWIGSTFFQSRWHWDGDIADVRFYTSALSTNEVQALVESQADADGDGVINKDEFERGTDPRNAASLNRTLYVDSDNGSDSYDGYAQQVLSTTCGPKSSVQSAINDALSGDVIELRGGGPFPDALLNPGVKTIVLSPCENVKF